MSEPHSPHQFLLPFAVGASVAFINDMTMIESAYIGLGTMTTYLASTTIADAFIATPLRDKHAKLIDELQDELFEKLKADNALNVTLPDGTAFKPSSPEEEDYIKQNFKDMMPPEILWDYSQYRALTDPSVATRITRSNLKVFAASVLMIASSIGGSIAGYKMTKNQITNKASITQTAGPAEPAKQAIYPPDTLQL